VEIIQNAVVDAFSIFIDQEVFDNAVMLRIDINRDFYFQNKQNAVDFIKWMKKGKSPHLKVEEYEMGFSKRNRSWNLTVYSKGDQCEAKSNMYLYGDLICVRAEYQIKRNKLATLKTITLCELLTEDAVKYDLWTSFSHKVLLEGELKNRNQMMYIINKENENKHRKGYVDNLLKFHKQLGKYGFEIAKGNCTSTYSYLHFLGDRGICQIFIKSAILKDLQATLEVI
jgi:hypothetical protein